MLEDALNKKQLRWDDVVRNVEYLGMRTRIKVFLGRWYANWLAPSHAHVECRPPVVHEDEEDGYECASDFGDDEDPSDDDMEFDDDDDDSSSSSDYDSETDVDPDYSPATEIDIEDCPRLSPTRLAMLRQRKSLDVGLRREERSSRMEEFEEKVEDTAAEEDDAPRGRTRNRSRPNAPEHSPKRRRRPA